MAEPLFFCESLADPGATLLLSKDEAHHAAASRRLHAGDTLWLFDGRGGLARTTLVRAGTRAHELELRVEERQTKPAPENLIHLACALPKGDRQTALLDMATQLGMNRYTPLVCERNIVKPGANSPDRWRRVCLEACKQSRRLHLPQLDPPTTPTALTQAAVAAGARVLIAHPSGATWPATLTDPAPRKTALLIGPEGGFTDDEVAGAVKDGARPVTLGPAILRIETAAVAMLAALLLCTQRQQTNCS